MFIGHDHPFISPSPFMGDRNIALLTELSAVFYGGPSIDITPLRG